MANSSYWVKSAKLSGGAMGTTPSPDMNGLDQVPVIFAGILTVSDRCSKGEAQDMSGPKLQELLQNLNGYKVVVKVNKIVPDEVDEIKSTLCDWADNLGLQLILTTGGTGFAPRDVTPEATRAVVDKLATGMMIAIAMQACKITPNAMLSRAVCGIRKNVLICNFPGSVKASSECFSVILPALPHAISLLTDRVPNIRRIHNTMSDPSRSSPPSAVSRRVSQQPAAVPCCLQQVVSRTLPFDTVSNPLMMERAVLNSRTSSQRSLNLNAERMQVAASQSLPLNPEENSVNGRNTRALHHHLLPTHHMMGDASVRNDAILITEDDLDMENDEDVPSTSSDAPQTRFNRKEPSSQSVQSDSAVSGMDSIEYYGKVARRERVSPYPMTSMDKAFGLVLCNSLQLPVVIKSYKDAFGHVLGEDVRAKGPLPPFPASIMDGYAVIASDTPGDLEVVGSSVCDRTNNTSRAIYLPNGKTVRVTTGAPLPLGADAVVPVEDTVLLSEADDGETELRVRILKSVSTGQDVRPIGRDIKTGEVVVKSGVKLGPSEIGLLACVGVTRVCVHKMPVVAVFSTGSELADPETQNLGPGEIRDANRVSMILALKQQGFSTVDMGIVPDDPQRLKTALLSACEKADVVVTSGGVSMGEKDFLKPLLVNIGATIHFGRIFMKPGKPTTFATIDTQHGKKCFFALPGNPVSAIVTLNLFVLPSLRKMCGCSEPRPTIIKAKLSSDVRLDPRPEYQRVHLRWEGKDPIPWADSTGRQVSSRLLSMVKANALLMLPPRSDRCQSIKRGEILDAMVIDRV